MDHFEVVDSTEIAAAEVSAADVVLGLCPGCELWQVDYTREVERQYVRPVWGNNLEVQINPSEWYELLDDVMVGHLMECRHLQRLILGR